ncbi:MAG: M23 family metallopeptidase [Paludibacteraceae bacterium]|nr:M23 family metallopeptidase [Paludibacteraceae bacterium]
MANSKSSFLHKLNFKYRLTIFNENTLEEAWHIRLSRLSVISVCFAVAVIYFLIIAVLIIKTPLRSFMPGYTSANELRKQVISQAVLLDSLQEQAKINDQYLAMLQKVVTGDIAVGDSTASLKDVVKMDMSKVQNEPSDRENQFCSQYEIAQRYATNSQISETSKNRLMHRPALGVVLMGFDPYSGVNGVTLSVDPLESVYSALDGSVIFAGYSAHNRYCLQIQHSESLVSMYKFTQPFLKRIGERVHAGEILATLRGGEPSEMTFELWLNGQPLDPNDYISFSTQKKAPVQPKVKKYEAEPVDQPVVRRSRRDSTQTSDTTTRVRRRKVEAPAEAAPAETPAPAASEPAPAPAPTPSPAPAPAPSPASATETPAPAAE